MDKTGVLGTIAGFSLLAILFSQVGSFLWVPLSVSGIVFGAIWFSRLD